MNLTLTNYWWLIIWLVGAGFVFKMIVNNEKKELVLGKYEYRWSIGSALLLVAPLIIWCAFRTNDFGDTGAYRDNFNAAPLAISGWNSYMQTITKDKGFFWIMLVLKQIAGSSDIMYFFILASVQIVTLAMVYRKYSCDYWFSIFVFVASTDYISWTFNTVRQFTAVALIFGATTLMLRRKYVPMIFLILIASTIHGSALLMIPFLFILDGKAWNKRTIITMIVTVLVIVYVNQFTDVLQNLLEETQYNNVVNDWKYYQDNGTNPIRVLVYSVPLLMAVIGFKAIQQENNPVLNMATNASILTTLLYVISMFTSGIFIGRLPIYVSL
ncbi:MAG: EpsG family protein [Lachnospiraceae bacterium]